MSTSISFASPSILNQDFFDSIRSLAIPQHQIRAVFTDTTIRVYQAYSDAIADAALKHQRFISPPFRMNRMTWIKPSFNWMMYRAGYGSKDHGQKRILAIDITREGFHWALEHSCPSHAGHLSQEEYQQLKQNSPVRIQWDPERDVAIRPLNYRSIQIGIKGEAVELYVNQWIQKITEVTPLAEQIRALVEAGNIEEAKQLLPKEVPYECPCSADLNVCGKSAAGGDDADEL